MSIILINVWRLYLQNGNMTNSFLAFFYFYFIFFIFLFFTNEQKLEAGNLDPFPFLFSFFPLQLYLSPLSCSYALLIRLM
jgi:hypothetical protein